MNDQLNFEDHLPIKIRNIHQQALQASAKYKAAEIDLINILDEVDRNKVHLRYGFNSLFLYTVQGLGLAENVAYTFINVTRKSREVPELKEEIKRGSLTVSKARKIAAVITQENKDHWIDLAKTSSQAKIEREVAKESPIGSRKGTMSFVHPQNEIQEKVTIRQQPSAVRVQLQVGISEKLMLKISRAKDLVGQKSRTPASLEQTLQAMVDLYLDKHDPLEKAKRQKVKGKLADENQTPMGEKKEDRPESPTAVTQTRSKLVSRQVAEMGASNETPEKGNPQEGRSTNKMNIKNNKRKPLPAAIKHRVVLKFAGQCSHVNHQGERCRETKFLEIHHLKPIALGGGDHLENLTLLCSGHHRAQHLSGTSTLSLPG